MRPSTIVKTNSNGEIETWTATTLDQIGKSEEYFEDIIEASPELLGLKSRRTGVHGPYKVFRQLSLRTPSGRTIFPDIVVLTASGHVIISELKKGSNAELYDRKVIAQIIDYASSFSALSEDQVVEMFSPQPNGFSWIQLIESFFPNEESLEELASELLNRIQSGKLNLSIACDKIPPVLPSIVAGIVSQSSLGFELDLVEVTPFIRNQDEINEIIFVPTPRLSTEIVSTTKVEVIYKHGDQPPSLIVKVEPVDEIEENIEKAKNSNSLKRNWTADETSIAVNEDGNEIALSLLQFVKDNSEGGIYTSSGKRLQPTFGLYVNDKMIFTVYQYDKVVTINFGYASTFVPNPIFENFQKKLQVLLGEDIDLLKKLANIKLNNLEGKFEEFKQIMLWFKQKSEERLTEDEG